VRAIAIVNANARRLRDPLRASLARALPGAVVFTRSLEEARGAIHAEVARGADLVVLGGGDGTVVMGLALISEACRGAGRSEPAIGVLRLGSANAIADAAGASSDPAGDLARLARGDSAWRSMRLLRVLGVRSPLVGVGVEARLLEDREALGRLVDRVPFGRRLVGDVARSALAIAGRSVQRLAQPSRVHAVISNLGSPAIEVVHGAPTGRSIPTGDILWKGTCSLVAGSTLPDLGVARTPLGFAAARGDLFHLRCGEAGWLDLLRPAPAARRGDNSSGRTSDFLCNHVQIELDGELSVEAGGELLGRRRRLELELGDPVMVASFAGDRA
jgi:diacylglycerol kinase family enzyme